MPNIKCWTCHHEESPEEIAKEHPQKVIDTSNGLTLHWLCAPCYAKTLKACKDLIEIFGDKAKDVHFSTLISKLLKAK